MPSEKTLALVIRSVDFSESSRVVTLFCRDLGKLAALAKGGRRLRGPVAGALDLLSVSRIVLIRKHSESLDLLTEAELVKGFAPRRNSLQIMYAGYYVAELLSELTDRYDPHPQLFDIAIESLGHLERDANVRLTLRRFEVGILRETGHMPHMDGCVSCGQATQKSQTVLFSASAGGLLCQACGARVRGTVRLHAGTVKALQLLGNLTSDHWRRLQLQQTTDRELHAATRASITHLTGRRLKTEEFLGKCQS